MALGDGKHVLVLEDEPAVQILLKKQLASHGFTVTVAGDGLDGLMKLESLKPDLIICDVMMPNLDGMGFVKAIKGHNQTQKIPVIFLTAKTDPRSMIDGINVGARFYVTKPFQIDDLLAKVQKALQRPLSTPASPDWSTASGSAARGDRARWIHARGRSREISARRVRRDSAPLGPAARSKTMAPCTRTTSPPSGSSNASVTGVRGMYERPAGRLSSIPVGPMFCASANCVSPATLCFTAATNGARRPRRRSSLPLLRLSCMRPFSRTPRAVAKFYPSRTAPLTRSRLRSVCRTSPRRRPAGRQLTLDTEAGQHLPRRQQEMLDAGAVRQPAKAERALVAWHGPDRLHRRRCRRRAALAVDAFGRDAVVRRMHEEEVAVDER